jgi:dipeptidyl aminopeptidase
MHVALFSPLDATEPIWLTEGEWEVTNIDGYNAQTGTV